MRYEAEPDGCGNHLDLEQRIGDALMRAGQTAAAAESLTGGAVSSRLSAIEGASDWFLGAVVAYGEEVKFTLLGVDRGPVINGSAAAQMAAGVARLLDAEVAVATTGVGGPGPQEGRDTGTVFVAVRTPDGSDVREYHFDGDPAEVVRQTTERALEDLARAVAQSRLV
ncbi:MAG TPA: CinA family protein [Microlunatus sp.]